MNNKSDIRDILKGASSMLPPSLVIDELKWKTLVRSVIRAKNVLILGPTGIGKTLAAISVASALKRDDRFFLFNLGATQDARSALIGNSHYHRETGTIFNESLFIKAIRTENAVILLDEISRAHPDASNILMTPLDELQRYVRLDEKEDGEIVNVANGVTFIATANVGSEYTATRVMDRALLNRFTTTIEMSYLEKNKEKKYLVDKFNITDPIDLEILENLLSIVEHTRECVKREDSKITNCIPTRTVSAMAELIIDGFDLLEIAQIAIYPMFSDAGGVDSERVYIKQTVQKYIPNTTSTNPNPFKSTGKNKSNPGAATPPNQIVPF